MVRYKQIDTDKSSHDMAQCLGITTSPEIARTIDRLYAKYGRYAIPIAELRKRLDRELGERTLTEELYAMREGR